jgi:hypothetical protein
LFSTVYEKKIQVGRLMLYQLSYTRMIVVHCSTASLSSARTSSYFHSRRIGTTHFRLVTTALARTRSHGFAP